MALPVKNDAKLKNPDTNQLGKQGVVENVAPPNIILNISLIPRNRKRLVGQISSPFRTMGRVRAKSMSMSIYSTQLQPWTAVQSDKRIP